MEHQPLLKQRINKRYKYLELIIFVAAFIMYTCVILLSKQSKIIMFIRHGEKIVEDNVNLSYIGKLRSYELINFIKPIPDLIIAMKQKNKTNASNRPLLTILPLALHYNIPINNDFLRIERYKLVEFLKNNSDKNILVCWEHYEIGKIVSDLMNIDLNWGFNPYDKNVSKSYTPVWILSQSYDSYILNIYNEFEIDDYGKISYDNVSKKSLWSSNQK